MMKLGRRRGRVLVLDDDTSMQKLVSMILRRDGWAVDVVSSGKDAIQRIAKTAYDLLLLDVMTPTEGGITVIRHLKEAQPALLKRTVLVTATPDSILKTVSKDVAAIVHKPFEPEELLRTISTIPQ